MRLDSLSRPTNGVQEELFAHVSSSIANPFVDAPFPPDEIRRRLVTVRAGEFMVSDGFDIPSTGDMAPCVAVGLMGEKVAVAHFTMSNDPESLLNVVQAMYPNVRPEDAATRVQAVMRGGMEELQNSQQLAANLLQVMNKYGIRLVGAELFAGERSGEAFGIDPRNHQIYTGATGIHSVQITPTPPDYYKQTLKPLLQVARPRRIPV
ncbi:MAG: hypothetical protein KGJ07_06565 [Patescibacteria group bacterium]|nr:hypothetical protein [Patescibacteria group bacterium]MDE2588963.1 hypothetical protein [Patescibacteria group bacterium]